MKRIAKLIINNREDRVTMVGILAAAGYKVSIQHNRPSYTIGDSADYFVVIEGQEIEQAEGDGG
mgnify:CR=1 FL=1